MLNGNCQALNSTDTANLPKSLGETGTAPGKVANSLNCKGSAGAMSEARVGLLGPGAGFVSPCQLRMFSDPSWISLDPSSVPPGAACGMGSVVAALLGEEEEGRTNPTRIAPLPSLQLCKLTFLKIPLDPWQLLDQIYLFF